MSLSITHDMHLHTLADGDVNSISGTDGDDSLAGVAGDDKIRGWGGNDTITESSGGDDVLNGGDGDDIITITRGATATADHIRVYGGAGSDTISYAGDVANQVTLNIDAGGGTNIIGVDHAFEALIVSGNGADTVTLSTDTHAQVHTGGGADQINVSADNGDARTGISTGADADVINVDTDNDGHFRFRLGDGADTVTLAASTDQSADKLVFFDFQAGDDGDQLVMDDYLTSVLSHGGQGQDPFATNHLRLIDGTTPDGQNAAYLEMDMDGNKNGADWVKLAVFVGVDASDLTAFNLGGIEPVVTTDTDFIT